MSVLDQQVRANNGLLFADIGSGGGGGGGSGNLQSTFTSTLTVSSIVSSNPANVIEVTGGGLSVESKIVTDASYASTMTTSSITGWAGQLAVTGDGLFVNTTYGQFFPSAGAIDFQDGAGALIGVSSINGQPYSAASVLPSLSTSLAGAVTVGSTFQVLAPNAISTVPGKYYWAGAQILDLSLVGGPPTLGDSLAFSCGQEAGESYLQTVDTCATSTIRGRNGTVGFSLSGLIEATSSYTFFQAKMNGGATVSTFVSMSGNAWLTPVD